MYTREEAKEIVKRKSKELGLQTIEFIETFLGVSKTCFYNWGEKASDAFEYYMKEQDSPDDEIIRENVKLQKKTQRFMDSNRIERKSFREYARVENALSDFNEELIKILNSHNLTSYTKNHKTKNEDMTAIIQISDTHFNELVDMVNNKYNFKIASQRLKKFADEAKILIGDKTSEVIIAFTGDIMNSDRRMDELLNQATNRANATIIAVDLLKSFILDLNEDYNVHILSVSGNESRMDQELGFSEYMATNNYDSTIFNILSMLFKDCRGISFMFGNPMEQVIELHGKKILITHGLALKGGSDTEIQRTFGRFSSFDILLDYVIFGHVHQCQIGDLYARSGSLVGANAYSERKLNVPGRASQNIHFVRKDSINSIRIDLQDAKNDGYEILEFENCYNPKSEQKTREGHVVLSIVI